MTDESWERLERHAEKIAESLSSLAETQRLRLLHDYPAKREPTEPTVTRIPTEEDIAKEALGTTEESLEEWLTLGPREREYVASEETRSSTDSEKADGDPDEGLD